MKDLIAVGVVSSIYPEEMTAKVYREDKALVTYELTVVTHGFDEEWMPEIGDHVLCVFLPRGSSNGFILGVV